MNGLVEEVMRRWRLRGDEPYRLREAAWSRDETLGVVKAYLSRLGVVQASGDEGAKARSRDETIRVAIRYARRALKHDYGPPPGGHSAVEDLNTLPAPLADQHNELSEDELLTLTAAARKGQARQLVDAYCEGGCSSFADVDRLYGWSRGHAKMIATRLREKLRSQVASGDVIAPRIVRMSAHSTITVRPVVESDVPWLTDRLMALRERNWYSRSLIPADRGETEGNLRRAFDLSSSQPDVSGARGRPVFFIADSPTGPVGFLLCQIFFEGWGSPFCILSEVFWHAGYGRDSGVIAAKLFDAFLVLAAQHSARIRTGESFGGRSNAEGEEDWKLKILREGGFRPQP
jgi:hypothetical protein